jgi:cytochrome c oxidase cbb3-type subunit 3
VTEHHVDDVTGTQTTGHDWDGIKELNTPLPRWWLWTFYACIVFALGYSIAYPAWPIFGSAATSGLLGYTGRGELQGELADAQRAQSKFTDRIAALPVADIAADPELSKFASAAGKSLFKVNCAQCHGSGAAGAPGYPNLNDDDWLWGGAIDQIYATITHGSRSADPDTHFNLMPNFGTDGILTPDQIVTVAKQVGSLSGLEGSASTPEGQQIFADNCAACHGDRGQGDQSLGGPALNDKIWLYGGSVAQIEAQVRQPRHGVMPAWGARLGDTAVKELAVYVHGLGGGQ